jgi:Protein of unknown function (DUF3810)
VPHGHREHSARRTSRAVSLRYRYDVTRLTRPQAPGLTGRQLRFRLGAIAAGILAWLSFRMLESAPDVAQALVGAGPIPGLMRGLSLISGLIPVPLAEAVVAVVLVRQGVGAWRGLGRLRAGEDALLPVLGRGLLRLAQDAGLFVFFFYFLWGFQYARPGLEDELGIAPAGTVSASELRTLTERAVEATNRLYEELHGSEDIGHPTPAVAVADLVPELELGWVRTREDFGLDPRILRARGAPKRFLASGLVKRLGISGMYFPFTGEALVLRDLPGVLEGKDMAHEMAHQRGFSSESDANVLGALVAARSPDPLLRYSAYSFMQRQLLSALQTVSPRAAREVARESVPGVRRDLEDLSEYWQPARTPVGNAAARVNDAMLRSHGIREGIASYQGSTWVFVALARQMGADAFFEADAG